MSAAGHETAHEAHGHDAHGHADQAGGAHHGTMKDYLTGFVLSALLTAIPFWIIMGDVFRSPVVASVVVMVFGVAQIYVHMIYFLHMNPRSEGGWNLMAAIFTIVIVVIALAGSMWVMSHLHSNMAPMAPGEHHEPIERLLPAPAQKPAGE